VYREISKSQGEISGAIDRNRRVSGCWGGLDGVCGDKEESQEPHTQTRVWGTQIRLTIYRTGHCAQRFPLRWKMSRVASRGESSRRHDFSAQPRVAVPRKEKRAAQEYTVAVAWS
jgi:hypothetical protein